MSLQLCENHLHQLSEGFKQNGLEKLKASTEKQILELLLSQPRITKENFEPYFVSVTMMIAALSDYHQIPPEALILLKFENNCPACEISKLGNPDLIQECIEECIEAALRLGLIIQN